MAYKRSKKQIEAAKAKRLELSKLSQSIKAAMELGQIEAATINEALIEIYSEGEEVEFKTFNDWKKEGYKIVKGSKSFPIWGAPIKCKAKVIEEGAEEAKEFSMFPICNVFSSKQVVKK